VPWHPVGDPFASESADYTATITATPGVQIVAGGEMTRQDNVWHFDLPRGRTFAFIASPRYWETRVNVGGVTYSLYTFEEHARLAPVTLQTAIRSVWLYNSLYGPYPYTTLRVAEVNGPWSMEFSGLVALGEEDLADYNGTNRNRLVRIAAHEVSHQWWYGVVGDDQAREPWLDEGMARFNELRYYEFYSPRDVWWWRGQVIHDAPPGGAVDSPVYHFHYHQNYISAVYDRGALFLDALREQIGQPAFNEFLRDLYRREAFRLATADDVFVTLSAHTTADVRTVTWRYFSAPLFETLLSPPFPDTGLSAPANPPPTLKGRGKQSMWPE
jgi:aminopeptidase N